MFNVAENQTAVGTVAASDGDAGDSVTGYARVSTTDQDLAIQRTRLHEAGCEKLFEEKISGARKKRPVLERLLSELRADDVVVVTRLDRLARSTSELLRIAETIEEKNAGLQSIAEPWADTTTPAGRMVLTVFGGIAKFERSLIATRTEEGRRAAQARGVPFGRPPKLRPDGVIARFVRRITPRANLAFWNPSTPHPRSVNRCFTP